MWLCYCYKMIYLCQISCFIRRENVLKHILPFPTIYVTTVVHTSHFYSSVRMVSFNPGFQIYQCMNYTHCIVLERTCHKIQYITLNSLMAVLYLPFATITVNTMRLCAVRKGFCIWINSMPVIDISQTSLSVINCVDNNLLQNLK